MKHLSKSALAAGVVLLAAMGGCASSGGYIPVTSDVVDDAGKHTVELAGFTKDASVAKEAEVHNTLRNRDTQYRLAYVESGFKMEFKMQQQTIQVPGMDQPIILSSYLPTKIEFRETPHFDQPLPTEQSQHPVWGMAKSIGNNLIDKTFFGWAFSEGTSLLKTAFNKAGPQYNGPVRMSNSLNSAEGDQQFSVADQYDGNVEFVAPEEPEGEEVTEEVTE